MNISKIVLLLFFALHPIISASDGPDSLENLLKTSQGKDKLEILNKLSVSYRVISPDKSIQFGEELLELSKKLNDPENQCRALRNIGIGYSYLSDYKRGLIYFEKSLVIAEENDLNIQAALSYNSIGNYHYLTGNLGEALDYYKKALAASDTVNGKAGMISYINNIGNIYSNMGNYDKALEYYFQSLSISEELKDKQGISMAYVNIGAIYNDNQNYTKALAYYSKAINISRSINDKHLTANILNNIGNIYSVQDKLNEALNNYKQSLKLKEEISDEFGAAISLGDIGNIYSRLGKNDIALQYQKRSYELQKKTGNAEGEIISLLNIGKTYINIKQYNDALLSFSQAEKLSKSFNAKYLLESYQAKAQAFEKLGDYRNAYLTFNLYSTLNDSLFNETSSKQLAELQTKYEAEKKDREISLLQRDKKIRELDIQNQGFIQNTLIAGIFILVVVAGLITNRYRLKKKANELLEEKIGVINKQKEELKILNANKDKLLSIISHDLRSPFQALVGYSELLALSIDELSKEEIINYSQDINTTSRQTLELLETLLEWSRLQLGKIVHYPNSFSIANLVNKTIRLMLHSANRKNVLIKAETETDYPVYADEQMITSALHNLLSNAIKFSHEGGIVKVEVKSEGDLVKVIVEDSGIGISKVNLDKIFNRDIHFSTKGTAEEKGSGLGLELCKELVEKNGGNIYVESEEGKGARFTFTIPLSTELTTTKF
ncbi:MAG: tetratricopeptide repeat-containing sensor histidine kinase [Ignavibacteriaceae bacterium]